MLTITQRSVGEATVLDLSGRFEFTSRKAFTDALLKAQDGATHIVLNFQNVPFIDSAALGLLALAHQNVKAKNRRLSIASPQDYVKKVLDLSNFPKFMPMFPSIEAASQAPAMA